MAETITASEQNTPLFKEYPRWYRPTYQIALGPEYKLVREIRGMHRRWGYWEFASQNDQVKARNLGLISPEAVILCTVHAHKRGIQGTSMVITTASGHSIGWGGLEDVRIIWKPGQLDGTKGWKDGRPANAWEHISEIRARRIRHGNSPDLNDGEQYVYTGTYFRWYLEPGADLRLVQQWVNANRARLNLGPPTEETVIAGFPEWKDRNFFGGPQPQKGPHEFYLKAADRRLKPEDLLPYKQPKSGVPDTENWGYTSYHPAIEGSTEGDYARIGDEMNDKLTYDNFELELRWKEPPIVLNADGEPIRSTEDPNYFVRDYPHLPMRICVNPTFWQNEIWKRLDHRLTPKSLDARKIPVPRGKKRRERVKDATESQPKRKKAKSRRQAAEPTTQKRKAARHASKQKATKNISGFVDVCPDLDLDRRIEEMNDIAGTSTAVNASSTTAFQNTVNFNNQFVPRNDVPDQVGNGMIDDNEYLATTAFPNDDGGTYPGLYPGNGMNGSESHATHLYTAPTTSSANQFDFGDQTSQQVMMDAMGPTGWDMGTSTGMFSNSMQGSQNFNNVPQSHEAYPQIDQLSTMNNNLFSGSNPIEQWQQYPNQQQTQNMSVVPEQIPTAIGEENPAHLDSYSRVMPMQHTQPQHEGLQWAPNQGTSSMQPPGPSEYQQPGGQPLEIEANAMECMGANSAGLQQTPAPAVGTSAASSCKPTTLQPLTTHDPAVQVPEQQQASRPHQMQTPEQIIHDLGEYLEPDAEVPSGATDPFVGFQQQQEQHAVPGQVDDIHDANDPIAPASPSPAVTISVPDEFHQPGPSIENSVTGSELSQILEQYGCGNPDVEGRHESFNVDEALQIMSENAVSKGRAEPQRTRKIRLKFLNRLAKIEQRRQERQAEINDLLAKDESTLSEQGRLRMSELATEGAGFDIASVLPPEAIAEDGFSNIQQPISTNRKSPTTDVTAALADFAPTTTNSPIDGALSKGNGSNKNHATGGGAIKDVAEFGENAIGTIGISGNALHYSPQGQEDEGNGSVGVHIPAEQNADPSFQSHASDVVSQTAHQFDSSFRQNLLPGHTDSSNSDQVGNPEGCKTCQNSGYGFCNCSQGFYWDTMLDSELTGWNNFLPEQLKQ